MFSNEEAKYLLKLPKYIIGDVAQINLSNSKTRVLLYNETEPDYKFLIELNINKKISFKISLHHQEHNSTTGLLRIDYKDYHTNPEEITNLLPDIFKQYVGAKFNADQPHIHLYVAGYKPLAWALPLSLHSFSVKDIKSKKDLMASIDEFAKEINVQNIQESISIQDSMI